jgi:hypothetical protein
MEVEMERRGMTKSIQDWQFDEGLDYNEFSYVRDQVGMNGFSVKKVKSLLPSKNIFWAKNDTLLLAVGRYSKVSKSNRNIVLAYRHFREGMTCLELGKIFGITKYAVRSILYRMGIRAKSMVSKIDKDPQAPKKLRNILLLYENK